MGFINTFKELFRKGAVCDSGQLRQAVQQAYSGVALDPAGKHPFPVGRPFAEDIGYPAELLDLLPKQVCESFTGVSNLSIFADFPAGSTVLDIGCGNGLDSFIAARKIGESGKVIGIDFSEAMIKKAVGAKEEAGVSNIDFRCAAAEELPLPDESIDVVMVNGIFNLNPFRDKVFSEVFRVLKRGCSVFVAELILIKPIKQKAACGLDDWFA